MLKFPSNSKERLSRKTNGLKAESTVYWLAQNKDSVNQDLRHQLGHWTSQTRNLQNFSSTNSRLSSGDLDRTTTMQLDTDFHVHVVNVTLEVQRDRFDWSSIRCSLTPVSSGPNAFIFDIQYGAGESDEESSSWNLHSGEKRDSDEKDCFPLKR